MDVATEAPNTPRTKIKPGSRAIVTIVRDEAERLPIWLRYYSRFFAAEDIYVLDHGTNDGSTDGGGFVRIPVEHDTVEVGWMWERIQEIQRRLLDSYETVLCTDVDEIVAPDPRKGDLGEYIDRFDRDFVTCTGYELIHIREYEPPLDLERPILEQRSHWFPSRIYSKPLLSRIPLHWTPGAHACEEGRRARHLRRPDPDLFLIHLHRMDYDLCLRKHRRWSGWQWSEVDLDERRGYQNLITSPREFDHWFYGDAHSGGEPMRIERIPAWWRGLF